jgi:hypothetical protein
MDEPTSSRGPAPYVVVVSDGDRDPGRHTGELYWWEWEAVAAADRLRSGGHHHRVSHRSATDAEMQELAL